MKFTMMGIKKAGRAIGALRRWPRPLSAKEEPIRRVLVLTDKPAIWRSILASIDPAWNFNIATTLDEARRMSEAAELSAVLVDRDMVQIDWRVAVSSFAGPPRHLSVILVSKINDQNLWDAVTRLGGYDVVPMPISADRLEQVLHAGCAYRRSQRSLDGSRLHGS